MGYFRRSRIKEAVDAVVGNESYEEYAAGDIEAAWQDMDRCLAKVDDDEPIFVLRAQDKTAVATILYWLDLQSNLSPEHRNEAFDHVDTIRLWQREHPERVKMPD